MLIPVTTPEALGAIARAERKRQGLRQDDLAATIGASHLFLRDVERGKPGVGLGRVMEVLTELGIRVYVDVPEAADAPDDSPRP